MATDPLAATVLDLDFALGGDARLMLGGGYGLYLKQRHIEASGGRTLLPSARLPTARTTQDIDLFLRAEIAVDAAKLQPLREALDRLGCMEIASARYYQFVRPVGVGTVKVDIHVGPLGALARKVPADPRRTRPRPSVKLHARKTEEALGIEESPFAVRLSGVRTDGVPHSCDVLIPNAFSYALMKLFALHDRVNDPDKDLGRHHALDLYRVVAMLTEAEDALAARLAERFKGSETMRRALELAAELFAVPAGLGSIRLREHPLCPRDVGVAWFAAELRRLISPR